MADWTLKGDIPYTFNPLGTGAVYNQTIATHASANTKGVWAVFSDGLQTDIGMIMIDFDGLDYSTFYQLIDVGIGSNGNEITIVQNLCYSTIGSSQFFISSQYFIPIGLKAGTRVVMRSQSSRTGIMNIQAAMHCLPLSMHDKSLAQCLTLGANTSTSRSSLSVDPGATLNTKGAWTQISASLPFTVRAMIIAHDNYNHPTTGNSYWGVDVGIGAEGFEFPIINNYAFAYNNTYKTLNPRTTELIKVNFSIGSRLVMRCQSDINASGTRVLKPIVYLFG